MAKLLSKLYIRIIISAAIGFFIGCAAIDIEYPCPPLDNAGCTSFESVTMHPIDLINNKQDSLTRVATNFSIVSFASFALLSVYGYSQKKKT